MDKEELLKGPGGFWIVPLFGGRREGRTGRKNGTIFVVAFSSVDLLRGSELSRKSFADDLSANLTISVPTICFSSAMATVVDAVAAPRRCILLLFILLLLGVSVAEVYDPHLGTKRVVFQTKYGDIEFGFYPKVAPKTVDHIFKLVRLGAYNTNHFFRVDKGFVAQVADVMGGREAPVNEEQRQEGDKTVPGEFSKVKHVRGILSMGRYSDPDSAASSFSILLGSAPHLDEQYAVFGKVTKGDETLSKLEELPTRTEGMFVMPLERITIMSTYYYDTEAKVSSSNCEDEVIILRKRLMLADKLLQQQRTALLP